MLWLVDPECNIVVWLAQKLSSNVSRSTTPRSLLNDDDDDDDIKLDEGIVSANKALSTTDLTMCSATQSADPRHRNLLR
jgi:hypothetical protein